ncbi:MAG: calcium-binding protein, partial [Phycisphaerae bacterium]
MSKRESSNRGRASLEKLEVRKLLSAAVFNEGVLTLRGDAVEANELTVGLNADGTRLRGVANAAAGDWIDLADVKRIEIFGGDGGDHVYVEGTLNIPVFVRTGNGDDFIRTGAGNDTVYAMAGNDVILLGGGDDYAEGGSGDDLILGGSGDDTIHGNAGNDSLHGGAGNDKIYAYSGRNLLDGGPGVNDLVATEGDSVINFYGVDNVRLWGDPNFGTLKPAEARISHVALYNADTNEPVAGYERLVAANSIDLDATGLENFAVIAHAAGKFGGSVVFHLDGQVTATESFEPIASFGDTSGGQNLNGRPAVVGKQEMQLWTYTGRSATGDNVDQLRIGLNFYRGGTTQTPPATEPPATEPPASPTPSWFWCTVT